MKVNITAVFDDRDNTLSPPLDDYMDSEENAAGRNPSGFARSVGAERQKRLAHPPMRFIPR